MYKWRNFVCLLFWDYRLNAMLCYVVLWVMKISQFSSVMNLSANTTKTFSKQNTNETNHILEAQSREILLNFCLGYMIMVGELIPSCHQVTLTQTASTHVPLTLCLCK